MFFFATLSFSPSSRVLVLSLCSLSCPAPSSLTTTSSLSPSTPPFPLGSLQSRLDVVQILCCHGDTVKLLQQGVQGGEEPPQGGFSLCSLPPAGTSHHHSWTEPQTQAQPESQADPRGFCQAAGAGGGRAPRGLRSRVNAVWGGRGVRTVQRWQAQGLTVTGGGRTGRWQLHALETHLMTKLRRG